MSVALIQHVPHESAGWLDDLFLGAGIALDVRRMWEGDPLPTVAELQGLVVLGGPMGAYDDEAAPWLPGVKSLLAEVVAAGVPTLGLCLGAQLLAVAVGGAVSKGVAGPELGLCSVTTTDAAADDALFHGVTGAVDTVQWHWDHVTTAPPGAVVLASSASYSIQAFRVGARAWGLQFHPEVTLPLVAQWAQTDKEGVRAAGLDPVELVGAVAEAERRFLETWTPLLERFVSLCI